GNGLVRHHHVDDHPLRTLASFLQLELLGAKVAVNHRRRENSDQKSQKENISGPAHSVPFSVQRPSSRNVTVRFTPKLLVTRLKMYGRVPLTLTLTTGTPLLTVWAMAIVKLFVSGPNTA